MARDFFINGETLVAVKGRADSAIGAIQELGLSSDQITIRPQFRHRPINVEAWGDVEPETQFMLAHVDISFTLIHFDRDILDVCVMESMGGAPAIGTTARAGARLGNNKARFGAGGVLGNHYIGLNFTSPVGNKPWRFYYAFLTNQPMIFPLGAEKSAVMTNWRAIPYTQDPYNGGLGAFGARIWDHTLDS